MKRIETSDDRGFDEPRVMRDEATSSLQANHAARDRIAWLERECRAADAALEALGVENDGSSIASRIGKLGEALADAEQLVVFYSMAPSRHAATEASMASHQEDSAECEWETRRERPAERLDDVSADEADPRDAVNERIAKLPREQRHEAMRRASCSYSAPCSAVRDGACIEGNEVVWPDGERYPMAPWHSSARGED